MQSKEEEEVDDEMKIPDDVGNEEVEDTFNAINQQSAI